MTQIFTDKKFIAHALIGAVYWGLAPRFIPISRGAAFVQGAAFSISMVAQQNIKNSNAQFQKALVPFIFTVVVGAFLKLSWKVNLLSSLAFTLFNQVIVRAQMPGSSHPPEPKPREVKQLAPVELKGKAAELPIDEPPLKIQVGALVTRVPHDEEDTGERFVQLDIAAVEQEVLKAAASAHPIEFVFSVDKSPSMTLGGRIEQVRAVLSGLLDKISGELRTNPDRKIFLSIVTFESKAETYQQKIQVTLSNIAELKGKVAALNTTGGTDIMAGLRLGTTQLETAHDVAACASLIFLTDGEAAIYESELRGLQRKWMDVGANFFALGIGSGHRAEIMQTITTDESGQLLPNTLYQWVPDSTPAFGGRGYSASQPASTEGVTLEKAVNAIFQQSLSQAIQSIAVKPTASFDVSVLNGTAGSDGSYELGGLSIGQLTRRYLRAQLSGSDMRLTLDVTVRTNSASHVLPVQLMLNSEEYDQEVYFGALKQEVLRITTQLRGIHDSVQKKALAEPMIVRVKKALETHEDEDLRLLLGDLEKALTQEAPSFDALSRRGRMVRGRFDPSSTGVD